MAPLQYKSRIHFLVARTAARIVVIQRKRSKLFHVFAVDTVQCRVEHGSWFRGKLYPMRADLSFDGKFMVYLAMGSKGNTWNGLCRPPRLTTVVDAPNTGAWFGGGFFAGQRLLKTNAWSLSEQTHHAHGLPFASEPHRSRYGGEDLGIIYERFERDGFVRLGDNWGTEVRIPGKSYRIAVAGDDGWGLRVSRKFPQLHVRYIGYLGHGYTFAFTLDTFAGLLETATWANWDVLGNLWVARPGCVERYTLKDLKRGTPSFSLDVDQFEPPSRAADV
jgi:hypothetical protein